MSSGEGGAVWGKGEVGGRNAATARDAVPTQRSAGFDRLSPRRGARLLLPIRRAEPLAGRCRLTDRARRHTESSNRQGRTRVCRHPLGRMKEIIKGLAMLPSEIQRNHPF